MIETFVRAADPPLSSRWAPSRPPPPAVLKRHEMISPHSALSHDDGQGSKKPGLEGPGSSDRTPPNH